MCKALSNILGWDARSFQKQSSCSLECDNPRSSGLASEDAVMSLMPAHTAGIRPSVHVASKNAPYRHRHAFCDKVRLLGGPGLYMTQQDIFVFMEAPSKNMDCFLPGCSGTKSKRVCPASFYTVIARLSQITHPGMCEGWLTISNFSVLFFCRFCRPACNICCSTS